MILKYFLAPAGVLALVVSLVDVVQAYDHELQFTPISLSGGGSFPTGRMTLLYTRTGNRVKARVQIFAGTVWGSPLAAGIMADQMPSEIIPDFTGRIAGGEVTIDGVNYVCYVDSRSIGIWRQASGDDRYYHNNDVTAAIQCNYEVGP